MVKIRKNSKLKVWNVYAANGESLGQFSFYTQEVKTYFPNCRIKKQDVFLA